ncbi:MAG: T9SS type A sorting domain-containing protein [Chitinophagales bacterium]
MIRTFRGFILLTFCLFSSVVFSQTYLHDPITTLKNNAAQALFPFTGGVNNPQFHATDFTADGIKDLVIFDRNGGKILTFQNQGTPDVSDYTYRPYFQQLFPPMKYWCVLVDYNCDGMEDIFTANEFNVYLYKANMDGGLHYELVYEKVKYHEAGFTFDLNVGIIDIPGFADVNFDGDLDVLTFNPSGGVVDYFENMQVEEGLDCDTLKLNHVDGCWGSFYESGLVKAVELDYACKGVTSKTTDGVHAGSTFLCFDEDADEDIDVVLGDLAFNNLNRLVNGGDKTFAHVIAQDTVFPAYDFSYDVDIFPAPFLIDIDNDEKKDMIVSPNKENSSENFKNVWFYKNISSDETYIFDFQTDSFFVSEMVDVGEGARPALFDYNNDGLLDIVIGNNGYYNNAEFTTSLALYENIGTLLEPSYQLITRDLAGISVYGFNNIAPTFGDMDGDGDQDLLFGESNGFIQLFKNTSAAGDPANFSILVANYLGIDVGKKSAPQIVDVNDDGLPDLIIGEENGNLNYYENTGTLAVPAFSLVSDLWGGVDVRVPPSTTGNSVPFLTKVIDGNWDLFVGSESGSIFQYEVTTDFTGIFTKLTSAFSNIDEGVFTSGQFADITNDGSPELLTGNYRGGITLYREEGTFDAVLENEEDISIHVFPNPASDILHFSFFPVDAVSEISIFDVTGKRMSSLEIMGNNLDISFLSPGVYFFNFRNQQTHSVTHKIIKL